jgi:hypothetical protein
MAFFTLEKSFEIYLRSIISKRRHCSSAMSDFWKKLEKASASNRKLAETAVAKNVFAFFVSKGLLIGEDTKRKVSNVKIKDCLIIGETLEPRILELLPAAIIHYPSAFLDLGKIPPDLALVISAVKKAIINNSKITDRPSFKEIPFDVMLRWASLPPLDKRVKDYSEKRVLRSYRFKTKTIAELKRRSEMEGISTTEYLEKLIGA